MPVQCLKSSAARGDGPAARLRVLVVDDNDVNREILQGLFAGWGIDVEEACDGKQAVEQVCTQDCNLDFVLMHISMPVMNGFTATRLFRQFEREHTTRAEIPVVAYTANELSAHQGALETAGFNAVLRKPSKPEVLRRCLSRWCGDKFDTSGFTGNTDFYGFDPMPANQASSSEPGLPPAAAPARPRFGRNRCTAGRRAVFGSRNLRAGSVEESLDVVANGPSPA